MKGVLATAYDIMVELIPNMQKLAIANVTYNKMKEGYYQWVIPAIFCPGNFARGLKRSLYVKASSWYRTRPASRTTGMVVNDRESIMVE